MAKLYVVATPIGNLNDLSDRVREVFSQCDFIAAEDTRVTMKLLDHMGLHKMLISCHRHNEEAKAGGIVEKILAEDAVCVLCSDAGTPAVSDPGNRLVEEAWNAGIPVIPVSGPSAAMTALSASGFYAREFAFLGFVPRETKAVGEQLERYRKAGANVLIAYESPHRVIAYLEKVSVCWPDCRVCVCCDLTKLYERIDRGSVNEVLAALRANPNVEKGEYCVVIECPAQGDSPAQTDDSRTPEEQLLSLAMSGMTLAEAQERLIEQGSAKNAVKRARIAVERFCASLAQDD